MIKRILIIEDEPSIAELISINLLHSGYQVTKVIQADEAALEMKKALPDLLILDWMLPGKSGVQFAKELKGNDRTRSIPILMLTAKGEELDKVTGLNAGADDYVTKPFSPKELLARVKALLRRYEVTSNHADPVIVEPLALDCISHRVWVNIESKDPVELTLGPTEFRLLEFFMRNPDRVHSRLNLLDHVWGNESIIEERTIDVHIKRLRSALAVAQCENMVETIRGSGYRLSKLRYS